MNKVTPNFTLDGPNCLVSGDHFEASFLSLVRQYRRESRTIEVDFRQLVPIHSGVDRVTHLVHTYPAKLLPNIPIFFLNSGLLEIPNSVVYDPFCGTGTVLLEAILSGHRAIGSDSNPMARKITRAKTTAHCGTELRRSLSEVLKVAMDQTPISFAPVVDEKIWFSEHARRSLGQLRSAIKFVMNPIVREFLEVSFSQCIRKSSLADPRMAVPVRRKDTNCGVEDVFVLFEKTALNNIRRLERLPGSSSPTHVGKDARETLPLTCPSVGYADMIITSPPYAGAQKYIRASSLSLGWLDLVPGNKLRTLEKLNIGRENLTVEERQISWDNESKRLRNDLDMINEINPLRACIFANYIADMRDALQTSLGALRVGGTIVLVIGDNMVCGMPIQTSHYIKEIALQQSCRVVVELVDTIKSRGLMTKRNKSAGLISHEHVIVFRKYDG